MADVSTDGSTKRIVSMIVGVITAVTVIFIASWVGWMSATQVDQTYRVGILEQAQKMTDSIIIEFKTEQIRTNAELIAIRTMAHEIRADQIRKQRMETRR